MARAFSSRRMPHRSVRRPGCGAEAEPLRTSDFVLALLGVVLLGGFALAAAFALTAGTPTP